MFDTDNLHKSKKLIQQKRFKSKPLIVTLDWLLDCMETGSIVAGTDPKYVV